MNHALKSIPNIPVLSLLVLLPALAYTAPHSLTAPELARTGSTILLLWEPSSAAQTPTYEVLQNGIPVGATTKRSFIVRDLEAATSYRFAIRARDASGKVSGESVVIEAATKPAGAVLNVREFGASGDGKGLDTAAIQRAIDACGKGGTILVPPGVYLTDGLELKSDITLHLAAGALLRFVGKHEGGYRETTIILPGPDGDVPVTTGSLLRGFTVENVSIIGEGAIDGNGPTWWPTPREFRPKLLEFILSRNIFIQGITLKDPPYWNTRLLYVDNAIVAGATFLKESTVHGTNGDGLNPDSARNVLIVGCNFGNQDDSIALKSGAVRAPSYNRQRSCENIVIRDCRFDGRLAPGSHPLGFAIGSDSGGGVRNVIVRDCEFIDAASIANIKSFRGRRHAIVEDIHIENCTYTNSVFPDQPWNRAPISLDMFYLRRDRGDDPTVAEPLTEATPWFRDIHFRNIRLTNLNGRAVYISGLAERPLENITFTDVTADAQTGLFVQNVDRITLENVTVTTADGKDFEWQNVGNGRVITTRASNPDDVPANSNE